MAAGTFHKPPIILSHVASPNLKIHMKKRLNSFRSALRLAALAAVLTTFSASAETLVFFPLNEGTGKTITDTTNNLTGSLGLPQNAETDTAVVVDEAPSGAAGDRSVRTQGNGFLMA